MKEILKAYFTYNNRERNGIIILLAIIVLLIVSMQLLPYVVKPPEVNFINLEKEVTDLNVNQINQTSDEVAVASVNEETEIKDLQQQLMNFDPNTADEAAFKQLGFSGKQIKTLLNYRNKGGHFYKKEDLKKIYGVSETFYEKVEPFIVFNSTKTHSDIPERKTEMVANKVELNAADSLTLVALRGIGPAFAHRMIVYRNKLGGYYEIQQLKEVYGMDSARFELFSSQLSLNSDLIKKMNINSVKLEDLKKHPYVKYELANLIINYRNQHGAYQHVDDIKKLRLLTDEVYLKLVPYLIVN